MELPIPVLQKTRLAQVVRRIAQFCDWAIELATDVKAIALNSAVLAVLVYTSIAMTVLIV